MSAVFSQLRLSLPTIYTLLISNYVLLILKKCVRGRFSIEFAAEERKKADARTGT